MGCLKTVMSMGLAVTALAAAGSIGARAADYLPPPPPIGKAIPAELGNGWYLRGDVGYIDYGKVEENRPYGNGGLPLERLKLDKTWSAGGGVGYQFTNWLRADITIDHRDEAKFYGQNSGSGYTQGYSTDRGEIDSTSYLFNAYFDLGAWSGVTPYIGAGAGVTQNRFDKYESVVTCLTPQCGTGNPLANFPLGAQPTTYTPARTSVNLAWALMGGVAVDVGYGFKLDLGYRYMHLGEAKTRFDVAGIGTRTKALDTHEVRFGVRYQID